MQKSLLKLLFTVAGLSAAVAVHALGMGGINVSSALGRPLQADIEIVSATKAEQSNLEIRLASSKAYQNTGLEYPHGIKFTFQLDNNTDGTPYLKVTSDRPINDPFVSLLLEVTWSSGKLLREYTFLLDPPGYVPAQAAIPEVQVMAPMLEAEPAPKEMYMPTASTSGDSVSDASEPAETMHDEELALPVESIDESQESMIGSAELDAVDQAAPVEEGFEEIAEVIPENDIDSMRAQLSDPAVADLSPVSSVPETLEVKRGDTMFGIAAKYKQADVSVERMLVALYKANVDKFGDKNMNRIMAGKIIRLPDADEILSVTHADAKNEIRVQANDWHIYRQKLASASQQISQPQESQQVVVGKISSSVIDQAPVVKQSAKEVLKLSRGGAPGDQAGAGGKNLNAQDKKNALQEDAIAQSKSSDEKKTRVAFLEKNLKDMERLAQLKAEVAAMATKPSGAPAAGKATVAANQVKVESVIQPVAKSAPKPEEKPKVQPKSPQLEPGLIDRIMETPLYLAGVLILIGLGGLSVMARRRKASSFERHESNDDEPETIAGSPLAAQVESSFETGDSTRAVELEGVPEDTQTQEIPDADSIDPISEAELFLTFGRDVQAEEILKDALSATPNNQQILLKLLGIYSSRQDVSEFEVIATQLKVVADDDAWQQAAKMGLKIDPNNVLYGGSGSIEGIGSATENPSVLDLGINPIEAERDVPSPSEENFLGDMEDTVILDLPEDTSKQDSSDYSSIEFTSDTPVDKSRELAPDPSTDFSKINLNLDDESVPAETVSDAKGDQWREVATKLDLAKAYQEMGDVDSAREILDEVLREGDAEQKQAAQTLFDQLG